MQRIRSFFMAALCLSAAATLLITAQTLPARGASPGPGGPKVPSADRPLPKMVDLGKTWCIPCKKMVAVLQEAGVRFKGKAVIEFVDLEKDPDAADRFKIQMIPTQIFYTAEGKEFERHMGYLPIEEVEAIFKKMGVEKAA